MQIIVPQLLKKYIVRSGYDQQLLTTQYQLKSSFSTIQNYAKLIQTLCSQVNDGIVVYVPSYTFLQQFVMYLEQTNYLSQISGSKVIFLESNNPKETQHAINCYKTVCDLGRGALFFGVARGQFSKGVGVCQQYGRVCVVLGVPYQYLGSSLLQVRLFYLQQLGIDPKHYLDQDARRIVGQMMGSLCRNSEEKGAIVLADERFKQLYCDECGFDQAGLAFEGELVRWLISK